MVAAVCPPWTSRLILFPTGVVKCCSWVYGPVQFVIRTAVWLCVCVYVCVVLPVLVLLVLLLFEACGSEPLAGQSGLHVLDLPPPQLPDGWTDEAPLVQIHGSIQLHMKHENTNTGRAWRQMFYERPFALQRLATCGFYICIFEQVEHRCIVATQLYKSPLKQWRSQACSRCKYRAVNRQRGVV